MQDTLVGLCAAGLWHEADLLIDHLVTLSEEELAFALQQTHGSPQWSSLHYASLVKQTPRTLSKLLQSGADVHARGSSGSSPLHLAAWNGCETAVQLLLAHGADIDATSNNGRTPLMFAARRGDAHMINALVQRGALVHATDARGRSALHFAAQSGQRAALHTLFEHGARDGADDNGVTARQLARDDEDDDDARRAWDEREEMSSEWSVRRTLSDVLLNVQGWRERFAGLTRRMSGGEGEMPPSPPPSPTMTPGTSLTAVASTAGATGLGGAVRRGELYAAVSAGILLSILLPMARGGGGGQS